MHETEIGYRKIAVVLPRDRKVLALPAYVQQAWVLLLMAPRLLSVGVYPGTAYTLATEGLRWLTPEQMRDALAQLETAGLVVVDDEHALVWVRHYLRYNPAYSPNHVRSWARMVRTEINECPLRDEVIASIGAHAHERGVRFREAFDLYFMDGLSGHPEAHTEAHPEAHPEGAKEGATDTRARTPSTEHRTPNTEHRAPNTDACSLRSHAPRARGDEPNNNTNTKPNNSADTTPTNKPNNKPKAEPKNGNAWGEAPTRGRRAGMAWEAVRRGLSVPHHLHAELLSKLATPDEPAMFAWYAATEARYAHVTVGEDTHAFWRREFAEWQGKSPHVRLPDEDPIVTAERLTAKFGRRGGAA